MENERFIYKYTFSDGKIYIGQTQESSRRFGNIHGYKGSIVYDAMLNDKNYKKEILEYCTEEEADARERYYISLYDSTNPEKGYNRDTRGCAKHLSLETRKKMSKNRGGRGARPIVLIDYFTDQKKRFDSLIECVEEEGFTYQEAYQALKRGFRLWGMYNIKYEQTK